MKHLSAEPTLWLKAPGDTPVHHPESAVWQPWYPEHQRLCQAGWNLPEVREWPQVVLFGGRQKEENRYLLRVAAHSLAPGGTTYFIVPNDYGSKSYQKELEQNGTLETHITGRKSRLYLINHSDQVEPPLIPLRKNAADFWSAPGLFSWEKVDRGSELLASVLQERKLQGPICDLGAGWGYLSTQLPEDSKIHLVEADQRGIEAAKRNLQGRPAQFHWADATELASLPRNLSGSFKTVITNPPFHTNRKAEPVLGGAFVANSHTLLGNRGVLYLVGNSHLPYGKILRAFFPKVEEVLQKDGFVVYRGQKS